MPRTRVVPMSLTLLVASLSAASAQMPSPPTVTVRNGQLSVAVHGVPLEAVLLEIGRQAAVRIHMDVGPRDRREHETATVTFDGVTIDEGLRRVLRNRNFAFVYVNDVLVETRVYGEARRRLVEIGDQGRRGPPDTRQAAPEAASRSDQIIAKLATGGDDRRLLVTALDVLETEKDPDILDQALRALKGLEKVPIDKLMKFASGAEDPDLVGQALRLLVNHGERDRSTAAYLSELANAAPNPENREEARSLLEDLRSTAPAGPPAAAGKRSPRAR